MSTAFALQHFLLQYEETKAYAVIMAQELSEDKTMGGLQHAGKEVQELSHSRTSVNARLAPHP